MTSTISSYSIHNQTLYNNYLSLCPCSQLSFFQLPHTNKLTFLTYYILIVRYISAQVNNYQNQENMLKQPELQSKQPSQSLETKNKQKGFQEIGSKE